MTSIGSPSPFFFGGKKEYQVERSLRINKPDNPQLYRTGSNNANTFTVSMWIKIGNLYTSYRRLFGSYADALNLNNDHRLRYIDEGDGSFYSTAKFRDPTAWYHIVMAVNTSGTTVYVNNVTHITSSSKFSLSTSSNAIRHFWNPGDPAEFAFDGYGAEVALIDGQALTPSSFAETNAITGQWTPKDLSELTFGSNGHYLKFTDSTNLGKDFSGNNNNFTVVNFATTDAVKDSPTNNFCTLNPLSRTNKTESEGNLETRANDGAWRSGSTTFHMSSGKWYWELHVTALGSYQMHGIVPAVRQNGKVNFNADIYPGSYSNEWGYANNGTLYNSASGTSSWGATYTTGDILSFALDMDNGTLDIKKNNSATGSQITGISGEYRPVFTNWATSSITNVNFGQDSSFAGEKTAQGNTDGSGQGDFYYTPPSGYKALCSANLPDPTILLPNEHFNTLLWSGDSANSRDITGLNFKPDWVWIKSRNYSSYGGGLNYNHVVWDALRGAGSASTPPSNMAGRKELTINENYSEGSSSNYTNYYGHVSAFNSDGFTLGKVSGEPALFTNLNGRTYVGWNWNAGDTDGKTYIVKVVSDSGNKYRFDNFGTSAVTLDLAEGGTYIFNMDDSSNATHPFSIGTAANGTVYTSGITYFLDGVSKTYSEYTSGFSAASTRRLHITVPASAPVLYYWCSAHSGMGGQINTNSTLGSSNFDGTIQATVKANASAGISIVGYKGNNSAGATIGHGLGVAPSVLIVKNRDSTRGWMVYHHKNTSAPATEYLWLDQNSATADYDGSWNDTAPTSTVFSIGNSNETNENNSDHIAYCFSEVAGYSKFGSYVGNGNSDGVFVFTGFRPAWVLIKNSGAGGFDWVLQDATRSPFNVADAKLNPNNNAVEQTGNDRIDMLSNGFKLRDSSAGINANGSSSYIYLAFAESPFKNARAR